MLSVFLFLINFSFAADTSYTHIKEGQKAPFDGVLMTNDALIQMISTQESEVKTCELDKKTQLDLQKNELNTKYQLYEARCEAEKVMNEELIAIRDEQLKKDRAKDIIQRAAFFGGFVLGATTSVGIVYSLNQN